MSDKVVIAKEKLANIEKELADLRSENKLLKRSKNVHYNKDLRILGRSYQDSRSIIMLIFSELPYSIQFCKEVGITERRYYWALGLLRLSNVISKNGRRVLCNTVSEAITLLNMRYESLQSEEEPTILLREVLPKKMQHYRELKDWYE
jgi:hypothetical protein